MQIIELPSHPYFVGVQFHPEFKSRPGKPSALFLGTSKSQLLISLASLSLLTKCRCKASTNKII